MDFCYKGKVRTMTENITELLRNNGYKVTPQRLAIYEALCATKEHPKAETLFVKLQPSYPTMSLATVYKTIDILKKIEKQTGYTITEQRVYFFGKCAQCSK